MEIDENADVVNVLVTTGQLVPTLGKLLLFKLDGAFKATCKLSLLWPCISCPLDYGNHCIASLLACFPLLIAHCRASEDALAWLVPCLPVVLHSAANWAIARRQRASKAAMQEHLLQHSSSIVYNSLHLA